MKPKELGEEIAIELELMEATVRELLALQRDLAGREPTVREKTAAAAFLAQFYSGVENVLKRISRFHAVPLPTSDTWHVDLFRRFCMPPYGPLPALFHEPLASALAPFRRFRHVVYHSYGFELDWDRMDEGMERVSPVFAQFKAVLSEYLQTLAGE